ncbi:MAG: hypothetical protein EPN47_07780 [Acidobacteria bacterium]|nr:MAG: hypothetical protein EPN47_07780 [Acidobacteriota bacterium]
MIGMGFEAFLTLFIISFIAAIVIHNGIHYHVLSGVDGFFAKWIFGWLGAWIATPVLGHWFSGFAISGQYIIPAFLGAFSTAFMITAVCKMMARTRTAGAESPERVTAPGVATSEVVHGTRAA